MTHCVLCSSPQIRQGYLEEVLIIRHSVVILLIDQNRYVFQLCLGEYFDLGSSAAIDLNVWGLPHCGGKVYYLCENPFAQY